MNFYLNGIPRPFLLQNRLLYSREANIVHFAAVGCDMRRFCGVQGDTRVHGEVLCLNGFNFFSD